MLIPNPHSSWFMKQSLIDTVILKDAYVRNMHLVLLNFFRYTFVQAQFVGLYLQVISVKDPRKSIYAEYSFNLSHAPSFTGVFKSRGFNTPYIIWVILHNPRCAGTFTVVKRNLLMMSKYSRIFSYNSHS